MKVSHNVVCIYNMSGCVVSEVCLPNVCCILIQHTFGRQTSDITQPLTCGCVVLDR